MRKTLHVLRHEFLTTLRRTSFLLFAFGIPLLTILILNGVRLYQSRPAASSSRGESEGATLEVEGYVDLSGLVQKLPPGEASEFLTPFEDEAQASAALRDGEIDAYYVIASDYLESGEIEYVYPDGRPVAKDGQEWLMIRTLLVNLLEGDQELADRVSNPMALEELNLSPAAQGAAGGEDCTQPGYNCQSNEFVRSLPAVMVAIFYVTFISSSSLLFSSVSTEKENRTIEVLLMSASARQILAGKTMGLALAGLLQTAMWLGAMVLSLRSGAQVFNLPAGFRFPFSMLVWGLLIFLAGYAVYASLMAGAGAMVPRMKEAGPANFIATLPLILGYMVGLLAPIAGTTTAGLVVFLSFFPLTAPVVMLMRMVDGSAPTWQLLLSLGIMAGSAYLILRAVASMFQAQTLLSGQPFSMRRYLRAMTGRS